ncbi:MAG: membrane dipeptidase, partial [Gammaproteobacteria bacterium]|nr:membrane dipeptidase [Gammaproteobacteria bacterium]
TDGSYGITQDADKATVFYWKPTDLGSYLMLSKYERSEGEIGSKELLGLSDPFGEFLDSAGNLIVEAGLFAGGAGDMAEYFTNPAVLPAQGQIEANSGGNFDSEDAPRPRDPGDAIVLAGEAVVEQNGQGPAAPTLGLVTSANDLAVWRVEDPSPDDQDYLFHIQSNVTNQYLSTEGGVLSLSTEASENSLFEFVPVAECDQYPEAELNAVIAEGGPAVFMKDVPYFAEHIGPEPGQLSGDEIYGWVDAHAHISAYEFIGGRINYGDPFHKFGVDHALADCAENHGPQGMTGFVEHVTTTLGPHATQGWPNFEYWPRRNSLQHHQSYYKWIERAWLAGQKIMVDHLVHSEILCQLNPQKQNDCDPMPAILLQAEKMHDMQDYIDAQYGGPGKGWFRIVNTPSAARDVIADGKMAVVLGVEMSKVMNCGEFQGVAQCTEDEIVQRLDTFQANGVASLFPVHKFDNAFGGHKPDLGNPAGIAGVLYAGNLGETGHPIEYETCADGGYQGDEQQNSDPSRYAEFPSDPSFEPSRDALEQLGIIEQLLFQLDYLGKLFPAAPEEFAQYDPRENTNNNCNVRGLTDLGEFLISELTRRGMMIELDHISNKAAARILELTQNYGGEGIHYPTVNSHGGWSAPGTRYRIVTQGGFSQPFGSDRGGLFDNLTKHYPNQYIGNEDFMVGPFAGIGMSSDVNGIASLAGNGGTEGELPEEFTSVDGKVTFGRQKTGDKVFSLHEEGRKGVSHYGLYADQISDMIFWAEREGKDEAEIKQALGNLYSSAEGYIRMWERAYSLREQSPE